MVQIDVTITLNYKTIYYNMVLNCCYHAFKLQKPYNVIWYKVSVTTNLTSQIDVYYKLMSQIAVTIT